MQDVPLRFAHSPVLDGYRAIAVLIVVVSHTGLVKALPGGFGVTIFFFLSGYLITSLLRVEVTNSGRVDLRDFYARRTARILPPFYITCLLVAALCMGGFLKTYVNTKSLIIDGLFLTNYRLAFPKDYHHTLPIPLWSLDVEEHFYIIFSFAFAFFLSRLTPKKAASWCLGACAVILAVRILNVFMLNDYSPNYFWSHTRMDSILFGCVLALSNNPAIDKDAWRPTKLHIGLALLTLLFCTLYRNDAFRETARYTLQGLALIVIFSASLQNTGIIARILGSRPLRLIALISYTLYLVHSPALELFEDFRFFGLPILGLVASVTYATGMYWFVERPLAEWRRERHRRSKPIRAD